MRRWEYKLEGNLSSLHVSNVQGNPTLYRVKLSPPSIDGLFSREELETMLVLLANVLKDETP